MNWLPELLRNLTVSRTFTGALFIASISMLALPFLAPQYAEPVPVGWRWLVIGICIFSASLLLFWLIEVTARVISKVPGKVLNAMPARPLTDMENLFLTFMGAKHPNSSLDIEDMNSGQISKLEVLHLCKELERAGYVDVNPYNDNLVTLTNSGRRQALELSRQAKT